MVVAKGDIIDKSVRAKRISGFASPRIVGVGVLHIYVLCKIGFHLPLFLPRRYILLPHTGSHDRFISEADVEKRSPRCDSSAKVMSLTSSEIQHDDNLTHTRCATQVLGVTCTDAVPRRRGEKKNKKKKKDATGMRREYAWGGGGRLNFSFIRSLLGFAFIFYFVNFFTFLLRQCCFNRGHTSVHKRESGRCRIYGSM